MIRGILDYTRTLAGGQPKQRSRGCCPETVSRVYHSNGGNEREGKKGSLAGDENLVHLLMVNADCAISIESYHTKELTDSV
jgi:hypothetical protein